VIDATRESVISHLRAAVRELETGDRNAAAEHIVAARRLLGVDELDLCEASASSDDPNHYVRSRSFGHVCTGLIDHDPPHLCSCGHTWSERLPPPNRSLIGTADL